MSYDRSDYGPAARLLHQLALGNRAIAETAFAIDQNISRPDLSAAGNGHHVFVSGLARAGTTLLTRRLFDSGHFASLTYGDMPFPVAPNLWRRLRLGGSGKLQAKERAHGDGLIVDDNSPEALDETFWRLFDGDAYIRPDHLSRHLPNADLLLKYRGLVGAVLKHCKKDRYLCKNNNNVLRLPELAQAFTNATCIIPFRAPHAHAKSLLNQHKRFLAMHAAIPFSRSYMAWLAHYEFGADQRPFLRADKGVNLNSVSYWVEHWSTLYEWLLEAAPEQSIFVCYEDLCNMPDTWSKLEHRLGLKQVAARDPIRSVPAPEPTANSAPMELYQRLRLRSRLDLAMIDSPAHRIA